MQSIKHEFQKLKKRYELPDLHLEVIKGFPDAKGCYFSINELTQTIDSPFIVLKDYRIYQSNLRALLHEFCHALQDREGRFRVPVRHSRRRYALEVEAEAFSLAEYRRIYGNKYGKVNLRWTLASYDFYTAYQSRLDTEDVRRDMTDDEVVSFVHGLEGRFKKNIIRHFSKDYSAAGYWDSAVAKMPI